MEIKRTDVLIIGSGIAGLMTAERLARDKKVTLITKGKLENSNSYLAQGGIAAAIDPSDNWQNHFTDTIVAGNFHNIEETTIDLIRNGPEIINQLLDLGVKFDRTSSNSLELGREGGHQLRRVIHAGGDSTGKVIIDSLVSNISKNVDIYENEMALDLLVENGSCIGAIAENKNGEITTYLANHTVLATGGIGRLYTITSNDNTITGDGLALAYRAGAELADLEFIQFHPTMLVENNTGYGLVSEAVRGEGGVLINDLNEKFMQGVHPLADLAPRDIVAREIYSKLQSNNRVYLDISSIANFSNRFPTITSICKDNNIDLNNNMLPIAPGAHFIMGGVKVNHNGETTIPNLYAVGEVAFTGVHGANRLASNSLLEGAFFANKSAEHILAKKVVKDIKLSSLRGLNTENILVNLPTHKEIQRVMSNNVGIIRNKQNLEYSIKWFEKYLHAYKTYNITFRANEVKLLNMLTVGWLIATSALKRTESRGGHYRSDYPNENKKWLKNYIVRRREENESHQIKKAASRIIS